MNIRRCALGLTLLAGYSLSSVIIAQDTAFKPVAQQIPAPGCLAIHGAWEGGSTACSDDAHALWLKDIRHWRTERLIRIGYDGDRYANPATAWTQTSFIQPQMMVQDRYFYDPVEGK